MLALSSKRPVNLCKGIEVTPYLSKRDVVEVLVIKREAEFLAQGLHVLQWIDTGGEDEEDGGPRPTLLV